MNYETDNYLLPNVGLWTLTKHDNFGYYCEMFSRSMRNKWDCRVYLDLFAGAGKARIKDTGDVIKGSPLIALDVKNPFDKYVLCEKNKDNRVALKSRLENYKGSHSIDVVSGDCNNEIDQILDTIPKFSSYRRGITLCLVDPYKMSEIRFSTIKKIAENIFVDFLILIPSYMDINRNAKTYTNDKSSAVDIFLGSREWRDTWKTTSTPSSQFGLFVTREFCKSMCNIGFIAQKDSDLVLVKNKYDRNQPLYHLAFFSKHDLGMKFWRETKRNTTNQLELF